MNIKSINFDQKKIVVVGTIYMDIKGYPEGLFIPTGRNAGRIEYKYGGVARNVAEDLTGLGCRPTFVSLSEEGGHGAGIAAHLKKSGVNTDYILNCEEGIGTWMAIFTPEGDVCANISKRQSLMPLCGFMDEMGDEIFEGADGILVEMDVEEEVIARVYAYAEKFGIKIYGVISNMTLALERMDYIKKTGCFICNRQEAGQMFAEPTLDKTPEELLEMVEVKSKALGLNSMVVTMDKDGSVYVSKDEKGICPAEKTDIVDSTGAGDSFFAGVSAALINGCGLGDACKIGTAMAAEVIRSTENVYRR